MPARIQQYSGTDEVSNMTNSRGHVVVTCTGGLQRLLQMGAARLLSEVTVDSVRIAMPQLAEVACDAVSFDAALCQLSVARRVVDPGALALIIERIALAAPPLAFPNIYHISLLLPFTCGSP